jgi:hypothetical protein
MRNDLTGQKFNRLTAIKPSYYHENKRTWVWEFLCDCGNTHLSRGSDVKNGNIKSCGCLRLEKLREIVPHNYQDMSGIVFGRLTVIERVDRKTKNATRWLCKCDCGKFKEVDRANLVTGAIKSCGCLNTEKRKERTTTHGMSTSRIYHIWAGMISRCYNENVSHYSDYGGRGILVCDEWRADFMNFYADMSKDYLPHLTLDRIDVNGNYCKENCRWATVKEQARNKRNNVFATINGERKLVVEWAEENGIKYYQKIHDRLKSGFKDRHLIHGKVMLDSKRMIYTKNT